MSKTITMPLSGRVWPLFLLFFMHLCHTSQTSPALHFNIPEELPAGTLIGRIPIHSNERYHLTNSHNLFALHPNGEISLMKKIDRDILTKDSFELVIVNQDRTGFPITVEIHIIDINDNAPFFPNPTARITFLETDHIDQKMLLDPAADADRPLYGTIARYDIVSGNEENKFRLIKTQHFLHIENIGILDRETRDSYVLNISASDNGFPALTGYFLLNVTVGDLNDNAPVFDPSEYVVAVSENAPANSLVLKVHATDSDAAGSGNARIVYTLANSSQFSIDQHGVVRTTGNKTHCPRNKCQNHECARTCVLTVEARDAGQPFLTGRAYVYITLLDENDNAPEITFRYYPSSAEYATVAEDAGNGTTVAVVSIRDQDDGINGQLERVFISGGDEANQFRIDMSPMNNKHSLQAYSTASSASMQQLAYLRVDGKLDRARMSKYNLCITAVDSGHPSSLNSTKCLMVLVNDLNDYAPQFQSAQYSAIINENVPVGSFVQAVSASDADGAGINGQVIYSIVSGDVFNWFSINRESGLIRTTGRPDREMTSSLQLNISARDSAPNPRISYTTVHISIQDTNDNAPRFRECPGDMLVSVASSSPVGSVLYTFTAPDADTGENARISYRIKTQRPDQSSQKLFALDEQSGQMTTRHQLDRGKLAEREHHRFMIIASDHGFPVQSSTCTVTVRITGRHNKAPVFSPRHYVVPVSAERQSLPAGHKVTTVTANDADEGDVIHYAIAHSSHDGIIVDQLTGLITTNHHIPLTSTSDLVTVQIAAIDSRGAKAADDASVLIFPSLPEKAFSFGTKHNFTIKENSPVPTTIGRIRLIEFGRNVRYFLTGNGTEGIFNFDASTGFLIATKALDREEKSFYRMILSAVCPPYYAETVIGITVDDENDNAPVITNLKGQHSDYDRTDDIPLTISYPLGQAIVTIDAHDADNDSVEHLRFSLLSFHSNVPGHKQALSVNQTSGSVYLSHPLDAALQWINITVQISDTNTTTANTAQTTLQQLTFRIYPDSTCPGLAITQPHRHMSLPEDTPVNTRVMTFGLQRACQAVQYRIVNGNEAGHFAVFPDGQLYVNATLDRDTLPHYQLQIEAYTVNSSTSAALAVKITDVNNHAPQFSNHTYWFELDENMPAGSVVGAVQARDKDTGLNGQIIFRIKQTSKGSYFSIDADSGLIRSLQTFDRERLPGASSTTSGTLTITVTAHDRSPAAAQHTSPVTVHIHIRDQNDNRPVFAQEVYQQSVHESLPVGQRIVQIRALDGDSSAANRQLTYSMQCPEDQQVFTLHPLTGVISLHRPLNYHRRWRYDCRLFASDGQDVLHTSSALFRLDVVDEDDQPPRFLTADHTKITLPESFPSGAFVVQVQAYDLDTTRSEILYQITNGNADKMFRINRFGQIYLNYPPDYEKMKFHNLTVSACKNSSDLCKNVYVEIQVEDRNDNAPKFSAFMKSTVRVAENLPNSSVVATALAHDEDSGVNGEIRYSILYAEPVNGHFAIEAVSGQIINTVPLDRERFNSYRLVLQATDLAEPHYFRQSSEKVVMIVVEDINDHAPVFTIPRSVIVPEYASSGYRLLTITATDPDSERNGHVTYDLTRTADMERFHLDRYEGHVYLRGDIGQLAPLYALTITARDQGAEGVPARHTVMTVDLIVVSHRSEPTLAVADHTEWTVYENETQGFVVGTMSGKGNGNLPVEYFLTAVTNPAGMPVPRVFDADRSSGKIVLNGQLDADQGTTGYTLHVFSGVKTSGNYRGSSSQVGIKVLSVNNRIPVFSSPLYRFRLEEGMGLGSKLGQVAATDLDRDDIVTFSIRSALGSQYFRIDHETGELFFKSPVNNNTTKICFPVLANDSRHQAEVTCCVDVNMAHPAKTLPIFTKDRYIFLVNVDGIGDGEQIGAVSATGFAENYVFHQSSDWNNNWFHVEKRTGAIFITKAKYLNSIASQGKTIVLQIQAADPAHFAYFSSVKVFVSLMPLHSNHRSYARETVYIPENVPVGTCFLSVYREIGPPQMQSGHISAWEINTNDPNKFGITSQGHLCVHSELDRETFPTHNLTLIVTSGVYRTVYFVDIVVHDINDEAPEFTPDVPTKLYISENSLVGMNIAHAAARDRDLGMGGEIEYSFEGPHPPQLSIDPLSGTMRLEEKILVTNADEKWFSLVVVAADKGVPALSTSITISVAVTAENNHSPRFSHNVYLVSLWENATAGHLVLSLSAVDEDPGCNGDLRFWILAGNEEELFEIDCAAGQIFLTTDVATRTASKFALIVLVEDGGLDKQNDTATVNIEIVPRPGGLKSLEFTQNEWNVEILENFFHPMGTALLKVELEDGNRLQTDENTLTYRIKDGDLSLFGIDSGNGLITLKKPLDREEQDTHRLVIEAVVENAAEISATATTSVTVTVIDTNDNPPVFINGTNFRLKENNDKGKSLGYLKADDRDRGSNSRFFLTGGSPFIINATTGEITAGDQLDREIRVVYALTATVTDGLHFTSTNVTVHVLDEDDNVPTFDENNQIRYIPDNHGDGSFLCALSASDSDENGFSRLRYTLKTLPNMLNLNANTGIITSRSRVPSGTTAEIQVTDPAGHAATTKIQFLTAPADQFPVFAPGPRQFDLLENSVTDVITRLTAKTPEAHPVEYRIVSGNALATFSINEKNGDIRRTGVLDYEAAPVYDLWVEAATTYGEKSLSTGINIQIRLKNVNDNSPQFIGDDKITAVLEEESAPVDVIRLNATDPDGDSVGFYLINGTDRFTIDRESGVLRCIAPVDREKVPFMTVSVGITDGIFTATALVQISVLDKNDNPPKFSRQFTANITETAAAGTFVLKVTSVDADVGTNAVASYSLINKTDEMFSIEETTGIIRLTRNNDREAGAEIPLEIVVRDRAWQSKSLVMVTVVPEPNDVPVFQEEKYVFYLNESAPVSGSVGLVGLIDDYQETSAIRYSFKYPSGYFSVDRLSGQITVKRAVQFSAKRHRLVVQATRNLPWQRTAEVDVEIFVVPSSLLPTPHFASQSYFVEMQSAAETRAVAQPDLKMGNYSEHGPNFLFQYADELSRECFSASSTNGTIYTKKTRGKCVPGDYNISVTAFYSDVHTGSKAALTIRLLPQHKTPLEPRFPAPHYEMSVSENTPIGSLLFTLSVSDDGSPLATGQVRFALDNFSQIFQIETSTGSVYLRKPLDYEEEQQYTLTITAADYTVGSKSSVTTVLVSVINENDNPPMFTKSSYYASALETDNLNVEIGRVAAVDPDNKSQNVYYTIEPESSYFIIDSLKGIITNTQALDFETQPNHTLIIRAIDPTDPSLFSEVTFFISVSERNEFAPQCLSGTSKFTVSAKAPVGSRIGRVMGVDNDKGAAGLLEYTLVGQSNNFEIDSKSGELTLIGDLSAFVSNEVVMHVLLSNPVFVNEEAFGTVCDTYVHVVDGNNMPYFMQREYVVRVREDAAIGSAVIKLQARIEGDRRLQYMLVAGDEQGRYAIDGRGGKITVARPLDREAVSQYSLRILARVSDNWQWSASVLVNVTVDDVNDNVPYFDPVPVGRVRENSQPGVTVLKFAARDNDLGAHMFTYRLTNSRWNSYFKLHPTTGVLTTLQSLDREKEAEIVLNISVSDGGIPPRTSVTPVRIVVDDVNDNPSMERPLTIVVYSDVEHSNPATYRRLGNVKPLDADSSGEYECKILEESSSVFEVDDGCELRANHLQTGNVYRLHISANDGKHPPVQYEVIAKNEPINPSFLDNSIAIQVAKMTCSLFLESHYVRLMQSLYSALGNVGQGVIFGLTDHEGDCMLQTTVYTTNSSGFLERKQLLQILFNNLTEIQERSGIVIVELDYKPCASNKSTCGETTVCRDLIQMIPHQNSITSSSSLIIASAHFEYSHHCACKHPFSGPKCELKCAADFCQNGGSCDKTGKCACPPGFFGSQCQFDLDECNLWGVTPSCLNGGKCINTVGSFRCECPAGYTGKQCEEPNDCDSSPGLCRKDSGIFGFGPESSAEVSTSLKTSMNEISMVISTVNRDGMLFFAQRPMINGGKPSHFIAVEIKNGRVHFAFGSTPHDTTRMTVHRFVSDGRWYRIVAVKEDLIGSLTVNECDEFSCVTCSPGDDTCSTVVVGVVRKQNFVDASLHIGKTPLTIPMDQNRLTGRHFVGCMRNFSLNQVLITLKDLVNPVEISENQCLLSTDGCQVASCSSNEICISAGNGQFQCVMGREESSLSYTVLILAILLPVAAVIAGLVIFYHRRYGFGKQSARPKQSSKSKSVSSRPPFLSPIGLFDSGSYQSHRPTSSVYQYRDAAMYKSDLCVYHAMQRSSPHFYCVLPERPVSHYASGDTQLRYNHHAYVNDANISACLRHRNALISPASAISEEPSSSCSTQPVDILSLGSVEDRKVVRSSEADDDVCSDCENCKALSTQILDWSRLARPEDRLRYFDDQPTYAEVNEFVDKATGLRQALV